MNEDQKYTKEQLIQVLQITTSFFNSHYKAILSYLDDICEYTIELDKNDKRKKIYYIHKILKPFAPYQNNRAKKKNIKEQLYQKILTEHYPTNNKEDKYQTGANVARKTQDLVDYAPSTHAKYISTYVRQAYGTYFKQAPDDTRLGYVSDRQWCLLDKDHNKYIPMNQEQLNYLIILFGEYSALTKEEIDDCGSYMAGDISTQAYHKLCQYTKNKKYLDLLTKFCDKFGYYPVMANEYSAGKEIPEVVLKRFERYENIQNLNIADEEFSFEQDAAV